MARSSVNNFNRLRISLASAEDIRSWSHGEVKKPETINYRTLKPEKDGLFCEKIFGPTKDWECSCGRYKRYRFKGIICERCGVEVTRARVRRERMGHIELAAPVSHIWYFKGAPSCLSTLLDIPLTELERVLYFASSIITWVDEEAREEDADMLSEEMEADLEEMEAERDRVIDGIRRQSVDYQPADDEEELYAPEERLSPEEVQENIEDTVQEFAERADLRRRAYDEFLQIKPKMLIEDDELYREMKLNYSTYFKGGMGAECVRDLLAQIDLDKTAEELKEVIDGSNSSSTKHAKAVKRLKMVEAFVRSGNDPCDMILDVIPVIPPDLRPMVQLDGGRFATSDLNDLYRRVINRNNRLKRLLSLQAPEIIVNNEKRMLQEAVDSLFDNGRRGRAITGAGNRPLKSLSDLLKGKQGRFRQNLLGKRVDYSGRSVIVVGPQLKMHQCGLPKEMALELFKPFVMKRLVELGAADNIKAAKRKVDRADNTVWDILEEVIADHPVLLNRAPTLHRLSIQAFEPVLVEGKAIRLHPLVCSAFNADFDGDQMAVHVPLSAEAQAEARVLMLSSNNIKSPAHGHPLAVPSQDMVIGLFYLTAVRKGFPGEGRVFIDFDDAINALEAHADVDLQAAIWVRLTRDTVVQTSAKEFEEHKAGERLHTTIGRIIFNKVFPDRHPFINYVMNKKEIANIVEDCCNRYEPHEVPEILDGLKSNGFHYATRAGLTVSVFDATIPPEKEQILADAEESASEVDEQYQMGFLSEDERHRKVIDIWTQANEDVGDAMTRNFDEFNPIYMMASSGARGNIKQIRQLAGMRGLMSNPKGETIDRPIKANFREGLSVLEYFISTHGARKGLADTALRTAKSGYLTRRLVDVAQGVIVREEDCGCDDGLEYDVRNQKGEPNHNLVGRCLVDTIVDPDTGEVLFESGDYLTSDADVEAVIATGRDKVKVRSVITCRSEHGVCQKCYGWDLAASRPVSIGTAVGIIAAQSIGEPGTQLTMRTFHTGGVAGSDITHGLPRVDELFEARRNPKGQAELAEISGTVQVSGDKNSKIITISNQKGEFKEYHVGGHVRLMPSVEDGAEVKVGQQLTYGSLDPHKLLALTDANTTLRYIVEQVQEVYAPAGVDIDDKHIEIIVRQMLCKVAISDPGDSDYLPGEQIDRFDFEHTVDRINLEGGKPPVGTPLLLGITKASLATDSWLSAASFQETTSVLTKAAVQGKTDYLRGLKENVITGRKIPAGTGLPQYRDLQLTYKNVPVEHMSAAAAAEALPEWAPEELREVESKLPQQQSWSLDGADYLGGMPGEYDYLGGNSAPTSKAQQLPPQVAKLYIYDDLGVSQRWANKLSEKGIETVGDLVNYTEDDLLRIEGIGVKAIEELKAGLAERDLGYILESKENEEPDANQLIEMFFSPDDTLFYSGDDVPQSYSASPDDDFSNMPTIRRMNDDKVLDEMLGDLDEYGALNLTEEEKLAADEHAPASDHQADADDDFDIDAALGSFEKKDDDDE